MVMGLTASLFSVFLMGAKASDAFIVLITVIATMGISILLISPITFGVSVLSFRRGLDTDILTVDVKTEWGSIIEKVMDLDTNVEERAQALVHLSNNVMKDL